MSLRRIEKQAMDLDKEERAMQSRFEQEVNAEASTELRDYTNALSEPYANKVSELEEKLLDLEKTFNSKMDELSGEDLTNYYYSEAEMLEDVQKTLATLNEHLIELLGERFQKELDAQLNSVTFEIQEENLEEICEYFTKLSEYFDNVKNQTNKFSSMETVVKKLNSVSSVLETGNKQLTLIVMLVLCFLFYFAFKFVFPFYVIALIVIATYNIKISSKIHSTSILRKVIQDNLSKIEQMYREKALAQLEQEKAELEDSFNTSKARLESELNDAKNTLESVLMSAKDRFNYDDSDLREKRDSLLRVNSSKKLNLEKEKIRERENYKALATKYQELKVKFDQAAGSLQEQYLSTDKVGDDIVLDPKFLIDIDENTKTPKFFEFNFGSSLFLYREIDDVSNFIRLFIIQLRNRLRASCINMALFDDTYMGKDYLGFTDTEDTKNENVLKLLLNKDDLKAYIGNLSELSINRTTTIKREFNNIVDYNKFMISQNSLPEAYKFFFVQNVDLNVLSDTKFKQLLLNGSDLGIYTLVFLPLENFSKGKEAARSLLRYFNSIYTFEIDTKRAYKGSNTIIQSKAKEFVSEQIIQES